MTANKHTPVDVLAVMDRAFGAADEHYDDLRMDAGEAPLGRAYERACRYMKEHREARAAVAELVEKNKQLTKAVRAFADGDMSEAMRNQLFRASSDEPAKSTFADLCTANDECEAALSRVRGAE